MPSSRRKPPHQRPIIPELGGSPGLDDEATPTGRPVPARLPSADSPPIPLASEDIMPVDRPPLEDTDATQVQPKSAFPGETQIEPPAQIMQDQGMADAPTRPHRITQQPPIPAPVPQRPPVREQPALKVVIPKEQETPKLRSQRRFNWLGCLGSGGAYRNYFGYFWSSFGRGWSKRQLYRRCQPITATQ